MNKHIDNFLDYYGELESPQYAVLIKGKWGSGKTHYIKEYKKRLDSQSKKYIYVSLYGVMNYDEIETKFLETLHPKLYNKKTILAGKIAKGFLKGALKIDLDGDGQADTTVNAQFPALSTSDLLNTQDHILIFDDLERCSLSINDMLGYINYFVEHQDYKVLIIANEIELDKDKKYKEIKEKLVGKTFELTSNSDLAFDNFINNLKNDGNKDIFLKNKELILETYNQSGYDNLRILRQTILDFERFYEKILIKYLDKKDLFKDILKQFFIFSIENKNSEIDIWNLESIYEEFMSNQVENNFQSSDESKELQYSKIIDKYNYDLIMYLTININLWKDIIDKSLIDIDTITSILSTSKYFINERSPNWKRLWSFMQLTDEEFPSILKSVYIDLQECKYNNIFEVRHICAILINLINYALFNEKKENVLKFSKKHLKYLLSKNLIDASSSKNKKFYINEPFPDYTGLGYHDENNEQSKKFVCYLNKIVNKYFIESVKNEFNDISNLLNSDIESLNSKFDKYSDILILKYFNLKKLTKYICDANYLSILNFGDLLKERYCKNYYKENLISENKLLRELLKKLNKKVSNYKGTVSGYRINKFIKYALSPSIESLNKCKEQKELREQATLNQIDDIQ